MTRDEYERRLLDRLRESSGYQRRADLGADLTAIAPEAIERFIALCGERVTIRDRSPAAVLLRLHLLRGEDVTVGGILLFGRDPQGPLPQATLRARATRGQHEDMAAIGGTLPEQVDAAVAFVQRNLRVRAERSGVRRTEHAELPLAAVRETITNAVCHRDYRSTAPIQLRLDDDALEVWNPGHLPSPLTPALLRQEHPSVPPNPLIARGMYLAGYFEEWGTGTLRVIEAVRAAGNPEPTSPSGSGSASSSRWSAAYRLTSFPGRLRSCPPSLRAPPLRPPTTPGRAASPTAPLCSTCAASRTGAC